MIAKRAVFAAGSAALALCAAQPLFARDNGACADGVTTLDPQPIWDGSPPGMAEWAGVLEGGMEESATPDGGIVFNVTDPTYQAFLPAAQCATGAAVLVVPGGGFRLLSMESEGRAVARWLAAAGTAAFVVKYRTVQYADPSVDQTFRRDLPMSVQSEAGIADTREALRLVRGQAGRFAIDPARTGAIGFSAGGHIVITLALDAEEQRRPAFVGNIYGALFTQDTPDFPPANLPYPPGTPDEIWLRPPPTPAPGALPPFFMAMAQDDVAMRIGFDATAQALNAAGYRPETHLYLKGGHGFGMKRLGNSSDLFIDQFYSWLDTLGMLGGDGAEAAE